MNANKGYEWNCTSCRAIGNDLKALKGLIVELQDEIKSLKQLTTTAASNNNNNQLDIEEVIEEINDRNKRKRNLVIFGIREPEQVQAADERISQDLIKIKGVLHKIDAEGSYDAVKPIRLGRFDPNNERPRPIKITLGDEQEVLNIIRKAKILKNCNEFRNVSISLDRTRRQLQYYKNLKSELNERLRQGEECRMKYINGIPKIVSLN